MVEISNVTNYENEYMKSRLYAIMYVDDRITLINNPNNVGDKYNFPSNKHGK